MSLSANVRSILDALCFDGRSYALAGLDRDALDFADRAQLTPLLASFDLPPAAREHAARALERNAIRAGRVAAAYEEIASAFDHVVLKGFTHMPAFVEDPRVRVQYDLDLYVPPEHCRAARGALLLLGYEPVTDSEGPALDHLPAMVRKHHWEWRGDYFDPDIPISIEIHFQFWNPRVERLRPEGLDEFWTRREGHRLNRVDILGYAAMHLTRHLLRGDLRVFHVWEMARFLHTHRDPAFWKEWKESHAPSLRRVESVAFLLARSWFACDLAQAAAEEVAALPDSARRWFEASRWSPVEGMFRPNKRELWLHLGLAQTLADRLRITRRRLLPTSLPAPVDSRPARYPAYLASRAIHHARLLTPTLWDGLRWWLGSRL
jgi:hypothetical protein